LYFSLHISVFLPLSLPIHVSYNKRASRMYVCFPFYVDCVAKIYDAHSFIVVYLLPSAVPAPRCLEITPRPLTLTLNAALFLAFMVLPLILFFFFLLTTFFLFVDQPLIYPPPPPPRVCKFLTFLSFNFRSKIFLLISHVSVETRSRLRRLPS